MLRLTKHALERGQSRTLLTEEDINFLYESDLTIPIGSDSEADHILFWSIPDNSGFVMLVEKTSDPVRSVITIMSDVYHQNQNRFVFNYAIRSMLRDKTIEFMRQLNLRTVSYKYCLSNPKYEIKYANGLIEFVPEEFNEKLFLKDGKIKDLIQRGFNRFEKLKIKNNRSGFNNELIESAFKSAVLSKGGLL